MNSLQVRNQNLQQVVQNSKGQVDMDDADEEEKVDTALRPFDCLGPKTKIS